MVYEKTQYFKDQIAKKLTASHDIVDQRIIKLLKMDKKSKTDFHVYLGVNSEIKRIITKPQQNDQEPKEDKPAFEIKLNELKNSSCEGKCKQK